MADNNYHWIPKILQGSATDVSTCSVYTKQEVITQAAQIKSFVKIRWNGTGATASNFTGIVYYNGNLSSGTVLTEVATVGTTIFEATLGNAKQKTALFKFSIPSGYAISSYELVSRPFRMK